MSLRTVFQNAARTINRAFGDVPVAVVYWSRSSTIYDASAGSPGVTEVAVSTTAFVLDFSDRDTGRDIQANDRRLLIAGLDLGSITAKPLDRVDVVDMGLVTVIDARIDPADAMWDLQVRLP
jgi:hypothetical protein